MCGGKLLVELQQWFSFFFFVMHEYIQQTLWDSGKFCLQTTATHSLLPLSLGNKHSPIELLAEMFRNEIFAINTNLPNLLSSEGESVLKPTSESGLRQTLGSGVRPTQL